jgi:FkbM family methyltransferase
MEPEEFMIQIGGLYFPDGEKQFTQYGEAICDYQKRDRDAVYPYVKQWRRALDVGANVGIFARAFAERFDEVVAFEPVPQTRECLERNVPGNVRVEPYAVADQPGVLKMYRTKGSGASFICDHPQVVTPTEGDQLKEGRKVDVEVRTIDSYDFDAVDLIKMDIQGAEYPALVGARETILRHRPVIMVEEKPFSEEHLAYVVKAAELLTSLGMTAMEKAQSDRIFVFDD